MDLSSVPMFALPLIVIFCAVRFGGDLQNKRYPLAAWSALRAPRAQPAGPERTA